MGLKRGWIASAVALQAGIYIASPLLPRMISWAKGAGIEGVVIGALTFVVVLFMLFCFASPLREGSVLKALGIVIVGVLLFKLKMTPYERVHLPEYAVLTLLYRKGMPRNKRLPFALSVLGAILDEVIQGILPNRYFDFKDILWNVAGCIVGMLL